ncbi:hypothetical protein A2U01_0067348, partial [Trifolium medium]|nr:hypothetical protein [Trifolium medium]
DETDSDDAEIFCTGDPGPKPDDSDSDVATSDVEST